jgi:SAM-dependent methyltransferase
MKKEIYGNQCILHSWSAMADNNSKEIADLKILLRQIGHGNIWRPVITPDNQFLSDGIGDEDDGILSDIHCLDFQGKTVVDLGCNLGYFCFAVKEAGAAKVVGIDNDNRIIRGCNIIKKLYRLKDIYFQALDITSLSGDITYDIGMMIDFIGKNSIIGGMLPNFLDALEVVSRREMILSLRPVYRIDKHLRNDAQGLLQKYSKKYVRGGCFYNMEYVVDRFRKKWLIDIISPNNKNEVEIKLTVHMTRKTP